MKGADALHAARCTPTTPRARGLADGAARARSRSRVGASRLPLEVTDEMMPGVVSLPHGWGHDRAGVAPARRRRPHPGVSVNDVTDEQFVDRLTGNIVFNGVPVEVTAIGESDAGDRPTGDRLDGVIGDFDPATG